MLRKVIYRVNEQRRLHAKEQPQQHRFQWSRNMLAMYFDFNCIKHLAFLFYNFPFRQIKLQFVTKKQGSYIKMGRPDNSTAYYTNHLL